MHVNKQKVPLLAMASEPYPLIFELQIWLRFKLEILQSQLPCRHLKTRHSDVYISVLALTFFMLLFLSEKNQNPLDIQEQWINKLGKI